jgi:hypothetical protein
LVGVAVLIETLRGRAAGRRVLVAVALMLGRLSVAILLLRRRVAPLTIALRWSVLLRRWWSVTTVSSLWWRRTITAAAATIVSGSRETTAAAMMSLAGKASSPRHCRDSKGFWDDRKVNGS